MSRFAYAAVACVGFMLAGCQPSSVSNSSGSGKTLDSSAATTVAIQLNWYPESEHGGVFQAVEDGIYRDAGLEVEIRPGGRATPVAAELELGRVQFAFANADDVVVYRRQGVDVVALLAALQDNPRCILVQADSGVESFEDLAGLTLQCQAGSPFIEFMRSRGFLNEVQVVPYYGSVSPLVGDPKIAVQAYCFAEPLLAQQQGVEVRQLMVSDLGWNPYSSVLITTGEMIKQQPDLVRRFVQATQKGWQAYFADPRRGNAAILEANQHGMTAEALAFGSEQMKPLAVLEGMSSESIGAMSLDRWTKLVQQMDALDPSTAGLVKPEDCFTDQFLRQVE